VSREDEFTWPTDFPPDCPPADSEPTTGVVYRIIEGAASSTQDFEPHAVRFPDRVYPCLCQAAGLSVFRDREDVGKLQRRVKGLRDKCVAEWQLGPECGLIKATPSKMSPGHHTWWVPTEFDAAGRFCVEEQPIARANAASR
jgi:hypothetical protein